MLSLEADSQLVVDGSSIQRAGRPRIGDHAEDQEDENSARDLLHACSFVDNEPRSEFPEPSRRDLGAEAGLRLGALAYTATPVEILAPVVSSV